MDVRVGLQRKLSAKELMHLNCGVREESWESLGLQDQTNQSERKSVLTIHWNSELHAEAETPILWPPDVKNWLTGKNPDVGKDWRWEEETTENEMAGRHHRLNEHEFEWTSGVGDGQRDLACCSPWGRRVRHDWETGLMSKMYPTYTFLEIKVISV